MKIKYLTVLLMLVMSAICMHAQKTLMCEKVRCDSIVKKTVIYFSSGSKEWIEPSQYKSISDFLKWAKKDTYTPIVINGWADRTGTSEQNEKVSLVRARSIRNYLVKKGVSADRISFLGCGVDYNATSNKQARRSDVTGIIRLMETPLVAIMQSELAEGKEEAIKHETTEVAKETGGTIVSEVTTTFKHTEQTSQLETTSSKIREPFVSASSRWYLGISAGTSFGRSTFCSFAMDGTRPGFNVGVLGGYELNRYLSAELSLDYTRMALGTYDCCQNLWLASDGNRYFAPLAGAENYQYNDLRSTTHLVGLGAHLNIDLIGIWKDDSRWSALVMPAIYGVVSSADVKQISDKEKVRSESAFHFGVGADLGVGYMITPCWGLRLKTGISLLTGKPMDAMPKAEHKSNYVWNTTLQIIIKL